MTNYISAQDLINIKGIWHTRGFHGHSRAHSRVELSNSFRQSAKPIPPRKFQARQSDPAMKHTFSLHDNKQIFLNDSTLFGSGLGKRKVDSLNRSRWDPDFITWTHENNGEHSRLRSSTIYQRDFCDAPTSTKLLTGRAENLAADRRLTSVYALNFSHGEPTPAHSKDTQLETYYRFINKNRARTSVGEKLSVANCMVWNTAAPAAKAAAVLPPPVLKLDDM